MRRGPRTRWSTARTNMNSRSRCHDVAQELEAECQAGKRPHLRPPMEHKHTPDATQQPCGTVSSVTSAAQNYTQPPSLPPLSYTQPASQPSIHALARLCRLSLPAADSLPHHVRELLCPLGHLPHGGLDVDGTYPLPNLARHALGLLGDRCSLCHDVVFRLGQSPPEINHMLLQPLSARNGGVVGQRLDDGVWADAHHVQNAALGAHERELLCDGFAAVVVHIPVHTAPTTRGCSE
mmetsp:Transcript_20019/g.48586  ORF Transcript_20019/g.48586 Transcript_20019/m.48586 type:complete len:236 (-) Transcript_20019:1004-1711(-)